MFDQITTTDTTTEAADFFLQAMKPTGNVRALDFMKRLSEDEEFRQAMVNNPVATAASFGFQLDATKLPKDGVKLPSRAVISRYLDIMATRFAEKPEVILIFRL